MSTVAQVNLVALEQKGQSLRWVIQRAILSRGG
jgi:hypothetical protein